MKMTDSHVHRHWDETPPEELRDWQMNRLRRYLRSTVLPFSTYYGSLGIDPDELRTPDDMEKIPFTRKSTLLPDEDHPKRARDFVLVPDEKVLKSRPSTILKALTRGKAAVKRGFEQEFRPVLMTSTTGRSTEPVPFFYTSHDLDNLRTTGIRLMEICNSSPEFRHMNLFPFAPHLAFWQAHYAGLGFNTFTLSTGGGKVMGTAGNVALMNRIQPDAIIGMPTFIYHLLMMAVEEGYHWTNLQRIVLGGEKVPDGMRRKLRALCAELGAGRVDVMATYGFTEARMAWPECPVAPGEPSAGYHLYPDLGFVEIIDPETGQILPDGSPGEIVFTPLDGRGSVVLRYRTGDMISEGLFHEPCPACGRMVPRLVGNISRVTDIHRLKIGKVKGTLVNFNELEHVLDDIEGVGAWQIELRKLHDDPLAGDELIVHVNRTGRESREQVTERIRERCLLSAEIRPNRVEFHTQEEMMRLHGVGKSLKEEKVVDNRPTDETPTEAERASETTTETTPAVH